MTDDTSPIRLLVLDIDGVLTAGEGQALDLDLLGQLAAMNRAARQSPARPAVTLCTGRPAPYVEVMLQAIDGHLPAIFENGAGLYVPSEYRFLPHPRLNDEAAFAPVQRRLAETLVESGRAFFQPGKQYSLSLFALNPADTEKLGGWAAAALGPWRESVTLVYSASCLNVLPRGVDKGEGLRFLADQTGYGLDEMLGVGDSEVDLPFLSLAGYSAAPANAGPRVRRTVQYLAPRPTTAGLRDILRHFKLA